MADSRLAQFIVGAKMIDEAPAMVTGMMSQFVVMQAKAIVDKQGHGILYRVWHPALPAMPLIQKGEKRDPSDFIPWLDHRVSEVQPSIFCYTWRLIESGRDVVDGFFMAFTNEHGHLVSREVRPVQAPANNENKTVN